MATNTSIKLLAEKKEFSPAMQKRATSLFLSYRDKRIAALKKKLVRPGSTAGDVTLAELKKHFEEIVVLGKKFPNETAGIPVLRDFMETFDSKMNTFRTKNKTVIANNQKILAEISLLEDSAFAVKFNTELLAYANKNKIVTTSKLTAAVVTKVGDKFVAAQLKSLKV